ncbi:MAG: DUF2236 domain-containing protein [Acidimicrobiia bacterium]|nr:DUF2236 domain-containing protein [Acidimicrobiia bacterium]
MSDAFPRNAVIRWVNDEPAIGFGAGRALLLQLAHPHVAAGVDEHSDFQHNPFKRLQGTLEAVYTMVYGPTELAEGVGRRVQWIHTFVKSPAYSASDPANLLWVHATLLDSALGCYERLVRPLSGDEAETYYQQMTQVAERFGCPRSEQPADYREFRAYWDDQVRTIEVTDVGRRLARDVIEPALPLKLHVPLKPLLEMQRVVAIGTLPEPIREGFGFGWDERLQGRLDRLHRLARAYNRRVPRRVRVAPTHVQGRFLLSQARRHVAQFEARMAAQGSSACPVELMG